VLDLQFHVLVGGRPYGAAEPLGLQALVDFRIGERGITTEIPPNDSIAISGTIGSSTDFLFPERFISAFRFSGSMSASISDHPTWLIEVALKYGKLPSNHSIAGLYP